MHVLLAALLASSTAHAIEPVIITPSSCMTRIIPCTDLSSGDGHILPPDWYWETYRELDGNLNWFRVEVTSRSRLYVDVGGYALDEHWMSRAESTSETQVYYVPAAEDTAVRVYSTDERSSYEILIYGAEKAPF